MTTDGTGGKGPDDDLLSELDAWDRTFDALHADEGLFGGAAKAEEAPAPSAPPPASAPAITSASEPAPPTFADDDDVTRTVSPTRATGPVPVIAAPTRAVEVAPSDEPTAVTTVPVRPVSFDEPTVMTAAPTRPTPRRAATAPVAAIPTVAPTPSTSRPGPRTTPPPPPRAAVPTPPPAAPSPPRVVDETDFSDLGFSGPPEALGSLLGQPPPLPPLETVSPDIAQASFDDDEVLTSAVRPDAAMTALVPGGSDPFAPSAEDLDELRQMSARAGGDMTRVASVNAELFEIDETMDRGAGKSLPEDYSDPARDPSDDTFERANRTRVLNPDDELLAEAGAAAVTRKPPLRTPAIVRRGAEPKLAPRPRSDSGGAFGGGESTRVADLRQLEQLARQRGEDTRASRPTPSTGYAPPPDPIPDDDFYADIEIGGDDDEQTGTAAATKRVTSNVVRRANDAPSSRVAIPVPRMSRPSDDDDELELQISTGEAAPQPGASAAPVPAARRSSTPQEDDDAFDAGFAEFAGPETTPVGERQAIAARALAAQPAVEPSGELDAIPDAVPEPVALSGAFAGGAPEAAPVALDDDPLGDVLGGLAPADDAGIAATSAEVPAFDAMASLEAEADAAAPDLAFDALASLGAEADADAPAIEVEAPALTLDAEPVVTELSAEPVVADLSDDSATLDAATRELAPYTAPAVDALASADSDEPSIELAVAADEPPTAPAGSDGALDALASLELEAAEPAEAAAPAEVAAPTEVAAPAVPNFDDAVPTAIAAPPFVAPPDAAPSPASAWADDPASQTKIGVPPPPLVRAAAAADRSAPVFIPAPVPVVEIPAPAPLAEQAVPAVDAPAQPTAASLDAVSLPPPVFGTALPTLDLDAVALPEHTDPTTGFDPGEAAARGILRLEQELELIDEPHQQAVLRIEAGRLYERLGDTDRARASYDAALLADPRATAALRGLRRIARGSGDLAEATTHLDAELGIAGPLERRALALHRVDLLMAASEQDLARVAVGELLDEAKGDVRAQLAQLELAFLDGRADELDEALERLGAVIADASLRAAVEVARGHLRDRTGERAPAAQSFTAAITADGTALAGHLGAIRVVDGGAALAALAGAVAPGPAQVGLWLEAARRGDPASAARAALAAPDDRAVQAAVLGQAMTSGALDDTAVELAARAGDPALRRAASLWAAARLPADDPRTAALHAAVLAVTPDDDLAAAAILDGRLAAGDTAGAAAVLAERISAGLGDELDRVRASTLFAAAGQLDTAVALVPPPEAIDSPAAADAWADVLGAAGHLERRAHGLAAIAGRTDERIDARLWARKAAAAFDRAVDPEQPATLGRALDAWSQVAELGADAELALPRAMVLAAATGDTEVMLATWARAQAAAESPAAAATLALARARIATSRGAPWSEIDELIHEVAPTDPRRLATSATLGAGAGAWADVALALEDRASAVADADPVEAALLRYRAAGLYLDRGGDAGRAATLLASIADEQPALSFVHDALAAARRRLGDAAPAPRATRVDGNRADGFARLVRDAEQLAEQGDGVGALALLARALELRPHDPLAAEPLKRVATAVREPGPITALALAELRLAEDAGDTRGSADAYEALARIDSTVRDDRASALISIEAAVAADPDRQAVVRELERAYAAAGRIAELAALRERQLATEPVGPDRTALALDRALLLERLDRPEHELRDAYHAILADAPRSRRALFQLESLVRRGGSSPELAALEDQIATYFTSDPRTRSAFLTRCGETLTDLGRLDDALARFREANELRGGYSAALEGWRDAALRGQLWVDFGEAAAKEATLTDDVTVRARLWHLAGVALMDRALAGERAVDALRAALAADPHHLDAFVRLRLLLDEQGEHEALAALLEERLTVETDGAERVALHRAIAELARNFLEDRERAKYHYRAIVDRTPSDLRAIAALSDIAWEQGAWGDAADALLARARLEREPTVLRNIHYRLGMIYADRLPDAPAAIRAFQRVLAHDPDDEAALERLADLGIATGEWRMALGACERLVKNETVPLRKVAHLHRVGRIFAEGFADRRKAERAYQLAVDAAPDSDVALGALIKFYEAAGDAASIRVHLGMVAAAMRQRLTGGLEPGAFRVLSRVARARHDAGVVGQGAVHRAAVDLARLVGGEAEHAIAPGALSLNGLLRPEADELLWPAALGSGLRQMVALLGDRLAKHVGIDLRPYGVTRGDRLRAKDSPVAAAAQEVAESLGLGEIDVYVSNRQPYAMVAEPTSPLSLVIGSAIADGNRLAGVRFAAAGALRLACSHLSILARLPEDELGVLVVALLRLFQPDLPYLAVDNDQVGLQIQRLRRLIPSSLMSELRPHALEIHGASFDHRALHRALETAAHRAGLVAAGGAAAPISLLLARVGAPDLATGQRDPAVAALAQFAVSEDFAALAALCQA